MSPLKLLRRNEEGAAAIEMAIALPVLLVIIYGIFQIGLVFQANAGMQHALGEGARYATLCIPTSTGCNTPSDSAVVAMPPCASRHRPAAIRQAIRPLSPG